MSDVLIYGAYGYTGELVARKAVDAGHEPVLAGRRESELRPLARELDVEYRAFSLGPGTAGSIEDVDVVAHCAGPFIHTYESMVEACIDAGTHYLDITGEIDVFEAVQGYDGEAEEAGVMLLPGSGFDVVPSDCLANRLQERLPSATRLTMAFEGLGTMSSGTARTMVEGIDQGSFVREEGLLTNVPMGGRTRELDTGEGPQLMMAIPWGDVSTAYYSTEIPNIEVYTPTSPGALRGMKVMNALSPVLGTRPAKRLLQRLVDATVEGPDEQLREEGEMTFWGEATDGEETVRSKVHTGEAYDFTAEAVLEIATRAAEGDAPPGYQTPATAYGSDLVLAIEGTRFEDIDTEQAVEAE